MELNWGKSHALALGRAAVPRSGLPEGGFAEKALATPVDRKPRMSQQRAPVAKAAASGQVSPAGHRVILPLQSALVRPHLSTGSSSGLPGTTDMDTPETSANGHGGDEGTGALSPEDRLRELGRSSWRRKGAGDPITHINTWRNGVKMEPGSCQWCPVMGQEVRQGRRFPLNIRTHVFAVKAVKHWHRLPEELAESPSLEILQIQLDMDLSSLRTSGWLWLPLV